MQSDHSGVVGQLSGVAAAMGLILHVGAHRTATTSLQSFCRAQRGTLKSLGVTVWGPRQTRDGRLHDAMGGDPAAADRLAAQIRDVQTPILLISDENMLGMPRKCLREGALYLDAGPRLGQMVAVTGPVDAIVLQIRALDLWWASLLAYLIDRGVDVPDAARIATLGQGDRTWRHVITDLAQACPQTAIMVTLFDDCASRPDLWLSAVTDRDVPKATSEQRNASKDANTLRQQLLQRGGQAGALGAQEGRYMPFDAQQSAHLREAYVDDLFWLRAGADGLATLISGAALTRTKNTSPQTPQRRGQDNDKAARGLAQNR